MNVLVLKIQWASISSKNFSLIVGSEKSNLTSSLSVFQARSITSALINSHSSSTKRESVLRSSVSFSLKEVFIGNFPFFIVSLFLYFTEAIRQVVIVVILM